ncbi:MAG: STAS domain-containing protein [Rubrobacteraceae bacterium]
MEVRHLEVEVGKKENAAVLHMKGEINGFAEEALAEAYEKAESPEAVVLDFTEVEYINSTGIALIVGLLAKARASGRRVIACGLSEHYVEIFTITRLSDFMSIQPVSESASQEKTER